MYAEKRPAAGIAETAKIDPTAKVGEGCSIADYAVIGAVRKSEPERWLNLLR